MKTSWNGTVLGVIPIHFSNVWKAYTADIVIPDGVSALYFTFAGTGSASFASFTLL